MELGMLEVLLTEEQKKEVRNKIYEKVLEYIDSDKFAVELEKYITDSFGNSFNEMYIDWDRISQEAEELFVAAMKRVRFTPTIDEKSKIAKR